MSAKKSVEPKKDTSPKVFQEEKLSFKLSIDPFEWTPNQQQYIDLLMNKKSRYVFNQAKPGTGKTATSLFVGLQLLNAKLISKVYYIRNPVESSSRSLGFLKGTLEEKASPYLAPLIDQLNEFVSPSQARNLVERGFIEILPLNFLKGRTFNASFIILDEAEDLELQDFRMAMTRMGKFSKMAIIGDPKQSHIRNNGFSEVFNLFDSPECRAHGVHTCKFTSYDIQRNDQLAFVLDQFDKLG